MREISLFVHRLAERCPGMRSIWTIGNSAAGEMREAQSPSNWDLVAFADRPTLRSLRKAADLHRADVVLRVVLDGDRFEIAWGRLDMSGSLFQWDWHQAAEKEAFYSEARWTSPVGTG